MGDVRWGFFRGIAPGGGSVPGMIADFKSSYVVSESGCGLDGVVGMMERCEYPARRRALSMYVEDRRLEYEEYWRNMLGDNAAVPYGEAAAETYLVQAGKEEDFRRFLAERPDASNPHLERDEIQDAIVRDMVLPLFDRIRKKYVFVYRDSDHRGIFAERR